MDICTPQADFKKYSESLEHTSRNHQFHRTRVENFMTDSTYAKSDAAWIPTLISSDLVISLSQGCLTAVILGILTSHAQY